MSWERDEKEKGWTRREWVKLGLGASVVGTIGGLGGLVSGQILPPPYKFTGEIRDTIQYTKFPTKQWWNARAGTPVKVTDFKEWQGATGVWRGLFQDGTYVPGTGLPCLIIRVKWGSPYFVEPKPQDLPVPLPEGFGLYYDDPEGDVDPTTRVPRGIRIVVLFDRCVHLCCYPGWHVVDNPPPGLDYSAYGASPPTWIQYGQYPVYCVCHGSQYDPLLLVVNVNDKNGARYVGAERVHGPAPRALPVIPVKAQGMNLVGGMADPAWYIYC